MESSIPRASLCRPWSIPILILSTLPALSWASATPGTARAGRLRWHRQRSSTRISSPSFPTCQRRPRRSSKLLIFTTAKWKSPIATSLTPSARKMNTASLSCNFPIVSWCRKPSNGCARCRKFAPSANTALGASITCANHGPRPLRASKAWWMLIRSTAVLMTHSICWAALTSKKSTTLAALSFRRPLKEG